MSYIEREPLIKILNGLYNHHLTMRNYAADGATFDCISAVIDAPTADVVEVVRCKDCKHSFVGLNNKLNCDILYPQLDWVEPTDYCSHGERREE